MTAYLLDWLSLLGRWLHLTAGIAWIGSSFYFIWLDNHLVPPSDRELARKGVAGELWAVHGGGFYNSLKYRLAPETLPPQLHWFYWEAYATFLSGFFLLSLLYYGQAEVYLIDPSVAALSKPVAIAAGLAFLAGGWLIYDALCKSRLGRNGPALGGVLAVLLVAAAWGLCNLFSGRGAYLEFGSMLGTIMVANVFFVIIPGQRELVRAKREGREPDPRHAIAGKLRSTHNTYFTLPVLFVMISNHYAMTFGARENWLVLIAVSAAGVSIRQYFVARHKAHERNGHTSSFPAVLGVLILACVAFALTPVRAPGTSAAAGSHAAGFTRIQAIVAQRCQSCHAAAPTQPGFAAPPNGVLLDSPEHILAHTTQMRQQLAARTMPVGNLTGLTDNERTELLTWLENGAPH
ncbi:MAG: hypothetical protein JWN85_4710 [Gammaproteobacteria bacterium]|nr:hypothetical protein [Gammaproteobacteria bacterium]